MLSAFASIIFLPFTILGMALLHSEPAAGRMAATPEPRCEARGRNAYPQNLESSREKACPGLLEQIPPGTGQRV
jgi:hypothetical protein